MGDPWEKCSKRLRYAFIHKNWRPETKKYDMSLGANFSDAYWKLASGKLTVCDIENGPLIVDLPIKNGGSFLRLCKRLPEAS